MKKTFTIATLLALSIGLHAELLPYPTDTINGKVVYRYTVEKSVGIYRISKMFECSQEDIIELNPQLKERGLHFEEVIYVPVNENVIDNANANVKVVTQEVPSITTMEQNTTTTALNAATSEEPDKAITESVDTTQTPQQESSLRLALLLPLQATAVERTPMMARFFDFYAGALLAVNDLQNAGEKIDMTILDIDKGQTKLDKYIADGSLTGMQGIVGPAYPSQVVRVAPYVLQHQIPCLIPFTDQVEDIHTNPYLLQFNATTEDEAITMAEWLAARKDSVHCILVEARESDIPESIKELRTAIRLKGVPTSMVSVRQILSDSLGVVLRDSVENILLFNTERYSNLSMMMPHVLNSKGNHHLTLLSQYSWQNEKILLPQIYTTEFATDLPVDLNHYETEFQKWFGIERSSSTPRYDLLGYDMVRQMVAFIRGQEYFGLQSDIRMQKVGESGGWKNKNIKVIQK